MDQQWLDGFVAAPEGVAESPSSQLDAIISPSPIEEMNWWPWYIIFFVLFLIGFVILVLAVIGLCLRIRRAWHESRSAFPDYQPLPSPLRYNVS